MPEYPITDWSGAVAVDYGRGRTGLGRGGGVLWPRQNGSGAGGDAPAQPAAVAAVDYGRSRTGLGAGTTVVCLILPISRRAI